MTYKENCEATISVRVSACKQYFCILELKDNHFKTYFTTVLQQRLLQFSESLKDRVRDSLRPDANKKVLLNKIKIKAKVFLSIFEILLVFVKIDIFNDTFPQL